MSNSPTSKLRDIRFPARPVGNTRDRPELSALWWLVLPIAFFILRYAVGIFTHKKKGLESWFAGELGLIENLTVVLLVLAAMLTVSVMYRFGSTLGLAAKLFLTIYFLGCIYFAGEEASWGQHWFGWQTGEYFLAINDQQETNFHNTSEALDRIPKAIVSLAIFIGGLAVPLYLRRKKLEIDHRQPFWWLFPTRICMPTALIAISATWPSKIERHIDVEFYFDGAQETKEIYIAYFFLLYILSLYRRLRQFRDDGREYSAR